MEYVQLRNKLDRWNFPKFKYSMRKLSEEEEKEMHKGTIEQLAKMGTTLKEVREFGQKLELDASPTETDGKRGNERREEIIFYQASSWIFSIIKI